MVLGDDELAASRAAVREMATGVKTELPLGDGFADAFGRLLIARQLAAAADAASALDAPAGRENGKSVTGERF
ncbi:MAG: hypothetical protein RR197_01960, partial [Oscillospiraceae bacterium]